MRVVQARQAPCRDSWMPDRRFWSALAGVVWALSAILWAGGYTAYAQNPDVLESKKKAVSSFPKTTLIGPIRKVDQSQPLYLQGDELVYDTRGNRVIARGNVEIFFSNYILTADEVIYDQAAQTLTAVGNATLKEPTGLITRGERITLTDDFRDGFVQSLSVTTRDDSRISAERASRREGNVSEFQNGKFTPCKSDPGKPPLWCIGASRIIHDQANANITYQDAWF